MTQVRRLSLSFSSVKKLISSIGISKLERENGNFGYSWISPGMGCPMPGSNQTRSPSAQSMAPVWSSSRLSTHYPHSSVRSVWKRYFPELLDSWSSAILLTISGSDFFGRNVGSGCFFFRLGCDLQTG